MNPDFRDMLSAFAATGVEYLVVGAYALAAHGMPRATGDIDLWVRSTPENAARVYEALGRFGAPLDQITVEDLSTSGIVFQIGVAPCRIDILTRIEAVEFDEAWNSRLTTEVEGQTITVLGREHFLCNKRALGRPKDLADVAWLEGED